MPPADGPEFGGVRSIYVGSLGSKNGSSEFRESLKSAIERSRRFSIAPSPEAADAVITGTGELWIRGYYSLNPRARGSTRGAEPIYGGYLSVELKGHRDETIWSYLVTPKRSSGPDTTRELANRAVKALADAQAGAAHEGK
jgi:hypothetical protein